jgi:hypothetical protein
MTKQNQTALTKRPSLSRRRNKRLHWWASGSLRYLKIQRSAIVKKYCKRTRKFLYHFGNKI